MFGSTYQFVQPPLKATSGEYDVRIINVAERNIKGYPVLTFTFDYADGKNRIPNTFDLFDVVNPDDEAQRRAFNIKASKIALCFGLKGGFNEESYKTWCGCKGRVVITRSKDGFLNVTDFIDKAEIQESAQ